MPVVARPTNSNQASGGVCSEIRSGNVKPVDVSYRMTISIGVRSVAPAPLRPFWGAGGMVRRVKDRGRVRRGRRFARS